ncbi:MAG: Bax inhibitor-1 family protein [Gemmataceae bacterium]
MRQDGYELDYGVSAAQSAASERAAFVRRVYMHLAGSVLALIGLEALLLNTLDHRAVLNLMFANQFSWLVVMLLFMGAGWVAQIWARSRTSPAMQYLGLALYIAAWAVVFLPLMIVANHLQPRVIPQAGILTAALFGGLTLSVFVTGKDYSFLGRVLSIGTLIALGVIIAGIAFGFSLGLFFSFAMVALVAGYILYDTSNVMLHYPTDMHVAATLELLADVAMLFWYIVQILLSTSNRD